MNMAIVAYLRVSTEKQFLENQREEIVRFAEKKGLVIDRWYMETANGKVSAKERKLSTLLDRMKQEGKKLGRKKGDMPKMKILRENKKQLLKAYQKGDSCSSLARKMGVSRTTMLRFLTCP